MGQIINSTFKFGFQLTSIKLEPKIVRERQVLSTRFDGLKLFEFNIGSYSTTVNNILRRIGEIWFTSEDVADDDENMVCDGRYLDPIEYPELFDMIGYSFGQDGDLYMIPDLRKRSPVGSGSGWLVGQKQGSAQQNVSHNHNVSVEISSHVADITGFENLSFTVSEEVFSFTQELTGNLILNDVIPLTLNYSQTGTDWNTIDNGYYELNPNITVQMALSTPLTSPIDQHSGTLTESPAHAHAINPNYIQVNPHDGGSSVDVVTYPMPDTDIYAVVLDASAINNHSDISIDAEHNHTVLVDTIIIDATHTHTGTASGDLVLDYSIPQNFGSIDLYYSHNHTINVTETGTGLSSDIENHTAVAIAEAEDLLVNLYHPVTVFKALIRYK
jgi:microcystin-dependent protein